MNCIWCETPLEDGHGHDCAVAAHKALAALQAENERLRREREDFVTNAIAIKSAADLLMTAVKERNPALANAATAILRQADDLIKAFIVTPKPVPWPMKGERLD